MTMVNITQELLKEYLEYRDGHLWWSKPRSNSVKVGQQLGKLESSGYRQGKLFSKLYLEHRLIWLYHYGCWPKDQIDHINGVRDDNRIENLRECTAQQNQFNKKSKKGSSSEYKGVSWNKKSRKWLVKYKNKGKQIYLGLYECELEATEVYHKATENLHKEYANYG